MGQYLGYLNRIYYDTCYQAHLPHLDPAISQYTIPQHHAQSEDGEISSIMAR